MTGFEGFGTKVREWFKGLEADNSREYFAATRDFFEESIREQMEALLTELSASFGGDVKMFRQNRDIRFSRDKSPYKTNTYGVLRGSDIAAEGLYASISANGLVAGSGYHVMARDQLERFRDHVAAQKHGSELAKLVDRAESSGLAAMGPKPRHGAARVSARPRADRASAPQESLAGVQARFRTGYRPRPRHRVRHHDLACRCARDGLAGPARGRDHPAAGPGARAAVTNADRWGNWLTGE